MPCWKRAEASRSFHGNGGRVLGSVHRQKHEALKQQGVVIEERTSACVGVTQEEP